MNVIFNVIGIAVTLCVGLPLGVALAARVFLSQEHEPPGPRISAAGTSQD